MDTALKNNQFRQNTTTARGFLLTLDHLSAWHGTEVVEAANQWFSATHFSTKDNEMARVKGRVSINRLDENAVPIHLLASEPFIAQNFPDFQKTIHPKLYGIEGGFVFPKADWSVLTAKGRLLAQDSAIDIDKIAARLGHEPNLGRHGVRVDEEIQMHGDRRVVVIGGSENWYDCVVYFLPKLLAIYECGLIKNGWCVALDDNKSNLLHSVVDLLNIPKSQIILLNRKHVHFFPSAIYMPNMNSIEGFLHPFCIELYRRLSDRVAIVGNASFSERIFISRENIGRRELLNEYELHEGLKQRGFVIIHPERFGMAQQIYIFKRAKFISGVHGAGFVNSVWSRHLEKILEISYGRRKGQETLDKSIRKMTMTLGASHIYFIASERDTEKPGFHFGNFRINPKSFFRGFDKVFS